MSSFSPSQPDFTRGLLCLPRRSRTQERSRTPRHSSCSHCCCSSCRCCSHCRSWWKKKPMENAATSSLHSDLQDITYGILRQMFISAFISIEYTLDEIEFGSHQTHPLPHGFTIDGCKLSCDLDLTDQDIQLCPRIEEMVTPELYLVLIGRKHTVASFHAVIYRPCSIDQPSGQCESKTLWNFLATP